MYRDSEQALESIFVSYNKILKRFKLLGVTTKCGKEITHEDLRKAVNVMLKKHPTCRWRSEKVKSRKSFKSRIFCFLFPCIWKVREITSLIFDINGAIRVNYNIKQVLI